MLRFNVRSSARLRLHCIDIYCRMTGSRCTGYDIQNYSPGLEALMTTTKSLRISGAVAEI